MNLKNKETIFIRTDNFSIKCEEELAWKKYYEFTESKVAEILMK